jgi:hypothetical protein
VAATFCYSDVNSAQAACLPTYEEGDDQQLIHEQMIQQQMIQHHHLYQQRAQAMMNMVAHQNAAMHAFYQLQLQHQAFHQQGQLQQQRQQLQLSPWVDQRAMPIAPPCHGATTQHEVMMRSPAEQLWAWGAWGGWRPEKLLQGIPRTLTISLMHGFGNRIRTIAAAVFLAHHLGRELHVHWPRTDACDADWQDLFILPNLSINSACCSEEYLQKCVSYDLPSSRCEAFGCDLTGIENDHAHAIVVRCAAIVSKPGAESHNDDRERRQRAVFYRQLQPSPIVRRLMAPLLDAVVRENYVVGVHIRQGDPFDQQQKYFFGDLDPKHSNTVVEQFIAAMQSYPLRTDASPSRPIIFFVTADQAAARRLVREALGGRIIEVRGSARILLCLVCEI